MVEVCNYRCVPCSNYCLAIWWHNLQLSNVLAVLPAEIIVSVTDVSVWMSVCRQTSFRSLLLLQFLSDSHETWHM